MGRWIQLRDANMTVGYTGGWCLKYVQDAFATDHPFPTATAAWNAYRGNHPNERPPLGITVPVFFWLGNEPAGHVAIRLDDGFVASSTLAGYHARPYFHPNLDNLIAMYAPYNGGCGYLGWSEYVGGVKVVGWEDYPNVEYRDPIAFDKAVEEDPTLPVGQTKLKQEGKNGEHFWLWQLRTIDGVEQSRSLIEEKVTPAQPEITLIGTYVEPEPEIPEEPEVPEEPEQPTDPEVPTEPTDPVIPVPPVKNEENVFKILGRFFQYLVQLILEKWRK